MPMHAASSVLESASLFLRQLSCEDRTLLYGRMERVWLEPGAVLFAAHHRLDAVYFPETVIVSIEEAAGVGRGIETAIVGSEGLVGWSALMGASHPMHNAIVQMRPGTLLRISLDDLFAVMAASRTLFAALMRFVGIVLVQMAQAIVSHLRDPTERRLCRWLLMRHDRHPSDHLLVRHDEISGNLGVRRASVTDCLHVLEGEHLLRCFRGKIVIKDREGLQDRAGPGYGAAEEHYRTLIGPFGRSVAVTFPYVVAA